MRRNALVFVALTVAVLAMLASGKYLDKSRGGQLRLIGDIKGVAAPDFTLLTLDGQKVKLSDYRGKAVLLNFWATWCPPCKVEMPWFVDLQKQYSRDGLVVLGVAMDDSEPAQIAKFATDLGVNYTEAGRTMAGDVPTFWVARHMQGPLGAFALVAPVAYALTVFFLS